MPEETKYTEQEAHKKFAVDTFNLTWSLLDKKDRTKEEDDKMIDAAHASRYHWSVIGTPVHFERGEWQLSRVYAVLNKPEQALYHAQKCLNICQQNNIGDFDIAFAYEAMARAHAVAGNPAESEKYIKLAKDASDKIQQKEDKDIFLNDLKTVPGYT